MAFTILPVATRQPGAVRTIETIVPAPPVNTGKFRIDLDGFSLQDEPDTTIITITVDRSVDAIEWVPMTHIEWRGNNGVPFRWPPHITFTTDGLVGQYISAHFVTNERLRYGILGDWV